MSVSGSRKPSIRFPESWASVHFDLLRGLAAIFVLLEHWRNLLFVDFPQLTAHKFAFAGFYILTAAGHQSVIVFFVLSGYFVGGTVFRSLERGQWEWRGYLLRRIARLWIVLLPALLLGLFWDSLGLHSGLAPALYSGHVADNMVGDVAPVLKPHIFFGNLFFLQGFITPVLGTNGALWSLANEFWYYLLFPLGLIALWRSQRPVHRLSCAILFFAVAWFVRPPILLSFPIWLAGVLLFKLPAPPIPARMARSIRIITTLVYAPIFLTIGKYRGISFRANDYLLTIITFFFLWILLSAKSPHPNRTRTVIFSREIARFSYTLYAVHVPLLVFLTAVLVGDTRWVPGPKTLAIASGGLLIALLYAWLLAYFTEFRTDQIRQRLEQAFGIATIPPILPSNPLGEIASSPKTHQSL
jgi:peptidoglycan/LPS O-acetylase OafA/YrhL